MGYLESSGGPRPGALVKASFVALRDNGVAYLFLALGGYSLKRFYADASAGDLRFVLGPTKTLVELMTGTRWPFEVGVGFVSLAHRTSIVAGCAGVNFLIACTATLVLAGVHRFSGPSRKALFVVGAAAVAYLTTIAANAVRIATDVAVRSVDLRQAWAPLAHDSVHRALGVTVYFGALCLVHGTLVSRLPERP